MKCEHCGKNEVTFVYQSNVNGQVTEKHLCGECAEKLGYTQRLAAHSQRMMQNLFSGSLFDKLFNLADVVVHIRHPYLGGGRSHPKESVLHRGISF